MKRISLTFVWILAATVICSAQNTLYLPQIADGMQGGGIIWTTVITVTNPAAAGTATANGSITLTESSGLAFNVAFTDATTGNPIGSGNTLPFQLSGGQTSYFRSTGAESLTVGFATVTSSLPVTTSAIFTEFLPSIATTIQGVTFNSPSYDFSAGVAAVPPVARQAISVVSERG